MDVLSLGRRHLAGMRAHVDSQAPLEACGLLAGTQGRVQAVLPVPNAAQSRTRFRMEPVGQLKAFDWIDANGMELLAIYHSHPAGPEAPSPTDIAEAAYDVIHIIWSRPDGTWRPRAFRITGEEVREVQLQVIDGPGQEYD